MSLKVLWLIITYRRTEANFVIKHYFFFFLTFVIFYLSGKPFASGHIRQTKGWIILIIACGLLALDNPFWSQPCTSICEMFYFIFIYFIFFIILYCLTLVLNFQLVPFSEIKVQARVSLLCFSSQTSKFPLFADSVLFSLNFWSLQVKIQPNLQEYGFLR